MASIDSSGRRHGHLVLVLTLAALCCFPASVSAQCPWPKNVTDLTAACSCSYVQSKLFVQCSSVNFTRLMATLRDSPDDTKHPIEQLHVSNSSVKLLPDDTFYGLRVATLQLSNCGLRNVSAHAFRDLESTLVNLNLPQNELSEECLPVLRKLRSLTSLDLSTNRIKRVGPDALAGLALDTLNLMENANLSLSVDAFRGLATSLKNLNLKGTGLSRLPKAVANLTSLAFLDLAHNAIDNASSNFFVRLEALTALSLEQNQLRGLEADAFSGLGDTMTSLSLLNNQFETVPTVAVASLKELRVLDLGFNKITEVPEDAFKNITSLTLLALDGNPLSTLPFKAFQHLRSTLRGLSVGGRSFVCDCHVRWISEWVNDYNLQVTSRERNPPFCGHPPEQRSKNLYLLRPAQLVCPETTTAAPTTTTTKSTTTPTTTTTKGKSTTNQSKPTTTGSTTPMSTTKRTNETTDNPNKTEAVVPKKSQVTSTTLSTTKTVNTPSSTTTVSTEKSTTTTSTKKQQSSSSTSPRAVAATTLEFRPDDDPTTTDVASSNGIPSLVRSSSNQRTARKDTGKEIRIRDAYRDDSTLMLAWDVTVPNVPGFRVVYRTFGDTSFKEGALLSPREKKFRMKVPGNECLVVCVLSRTDTRNLSAESTPAANCREIRGSGEPLAAAGHTEMDKIIIIAASAAICAAVIIAVIIFVCCNRRRRRDKMPSSQHLPPPIVSLPPMEPGKPEWDNASAYSSRSIPRARMYHLGGSVNSAFLPDDVRSHISHMSAANRGPSSLIDGHTYGGYMSPHGNHTNTLPNPYPLGRADMNRSAKSLAQMSYHGNMPPPPPQSGGGNNKKKRSQQGHHPNGKWASMSTAGSVHSLSGYDTENGYFHPNPWAGNEVDHYSNGNHGGGGSHISQPYNKRDYT